MGAGKETKTLESKIITGEEFEKLREKIKADDKTIVMCHGVYDLLHYGHIEHLQEAKNYGDIVVVSVTSAPYVNKGPDRPYFDDRQRTRFLASIEFVDYVMLSNEPTAITNIRHIQPDIYVKGQEFESGTDGVTGQVADEIAEVEKFGGTVRYTQGEVYSSSKLLNNYFGSLPEGVPEFSRSLLAKYGDDLFNQIEKMVDDFENLKVLVVGDIIIDEYIFCRPQGLTSKDTVISTRFQSDEKYLGGALAIARHVANFVPNAEFLTMMGVEEGLRDRIEKRMPKGMKLHILTDKNFVTPVKRRYLKIHPQRKDNEKLFSVNFLNEEENIRETDYKKFHDALEKMIADYDLVIVCDYGHGLIDREAIDIIEKNSKYLSVNCQTNSSNYGMNVITKYGRADAFALDEKELKLAFREYSEDYNAQLRKLKEALKAQIGWLTVGAEGAICTNNDETVKAPALTLRVTDTVGAGDAFFAISSLCAVENIPADIATLLSNAAGAMKTHVVGNKSSVKKKDFLKFIKTVLNV
ncbi:MAG: adenylyltransferase/cytidyltransferase family protein [Lachnospiraceae bacterium]|nr:adenylyltransferase/cytidyltransferase family protein [Lachnospiraceae bacterium]